MKKQGEMVTLKKNKLELGEIFSQYRTIILIAALFIIFGLTAERFASVDNVLNILKQVTITGVLAIGMTLVILIGGIDLSVSASLLLSSVCCIGLVHNGYVNEPVGMILAVLACTIIGSINGILVVKLKINYVIATLGMQMIIRGLAQIMLENMGHTIRVRRETYTFLNAGTIGGVPVMVVILIVLYLTVFLMLTRTSFGRSVYAVGCNEAAAVQCGLSVQRIKILCYTVCGLFAGLAGILSAARMGLVNSSMGINMEFEAVTAVVLGGASLSGGSGSVVKTLLGALIVGCIMNYMTLYGVPTNFQKAVTGLVILAAAIMNVIAGVRSE